ncbi:MAG: hypothetical protein EOP08_00560 [Proteobacteria bacterium]|nr:MAG: hypothetical protein EOP08_00560 [Pseudomonadota bacterium]
MEIPSIIQTIQASAPAGWMRDSLKAMPFVEATHVLAAATVFGTILIVDLRLIGLRDHRRAFTRVSNEMLTFTWLAFALAVVTGLLMFAANASTYWVNTAFRFKMLFLVLAGLNMAIFQNLTFRNVTQWDQGSATPAAGRLAGFLSIAFWITVIFLARWIGFTKGYDFSVPDDVQLDF